MKIIYTILLILTFHTAISQSIIKSKTYGTLEFKVLDYGLAKVKDGTTQKLDNTPTGTHGWLEDFEIINNTDSILILKKANFGVVYIVNSPDTIDINVEIEWIFPSKITNEKGEKYRNARYTTKRPTNIPSASSYSLDEPYEMIKGDWQMNIFIEGKQVCHKTFVLY